MEFGTTLRSLIGINVADLVPGMILLKTFPPLFNIPNTGILPAAPRSRLPPKQLSSATIWVNACIHPDGTSIFPNKHSLASHRQLIGDNLAPSIPKQNAPLTSF